MEKKLKYENRRSFSTKLVDKYKIWKAYYEGLLTEQQTTYGKIFK